jgi:MFS family permease
MDVLKGETETSAKKKPAPVAKGAEPTSGWALLLSRPIMMLFAFQTVFAMSFGGVRQFAIASLAVLFGQPQAALGVALTGYMAGASFGNLIGGWLADRFGRPGLIFTICIVATSVMIAIIGAVPMPIAILLVFMTLTGILQGVLLPSRDLLVRQVAPPGQLGKVFGFTSTGLSVGNAVVPIVFGWVMDHGDPRWIFYLSAAMMLCCMLTFAETTRFLRRRSRQVAPAE